LHSFAVDGENLYFADKNLVLSCKTDSCTGAPKQLANMESEPAEEIEVDTGFVYFKSATANGKPAIFRCGIAGCDTNPSAIGPDGRNGIDGLTTFGESIFAGAGGALYSQSCVGGTCTTNTIQICTPFGRWFGINANRIYFTAGTATPTPLYSCARSELPCMARVLVTTGASPNVVGPIAVAQKQVFFVRAPSSGQSIVQSCPIDATDCKIPNDLSRKIPTSVDALVADEKGIYWTADGQLFLCKDAACIGSPVLIASNLSALTPIRLSADYVYFARKIDLGGDAGADAGSRSSIERIAR
jgi:hypothetical protein